MQNETRFDPPTHPERSQEAHDEGSRRSSVMQEIVAKTQAERNIAARLRECGLELHPEKTKIVYCKDDDRRRRYPSEKFDFLGYTFQARRSKNRKGKYFINFSPAVSNKAPRPFGRRFEAGNCRNAATRRSKICPACS